MIPQKFLFENEVLLRSLIYPLYKGENRACNICKKHLKDFVLVENGNWFVLFVAACQEREGFGNF